MESWTTSGIPTSTGGSARRSPKGVLLDGAPGTGRRCSPGRPRARPAVPFFSVECVGVHRDDRGRRREPGPRAVRQARKVAPAIIFIDEIDTIGRARGGPVRRRARRGRADAEPDPHRDGRVLRHRRRGRVGGHQPADVLDPALLRPGGSTDDRRERAGPARPARRSSRCMPRQLPLAPDAAPSTCRVVHVRA